MKGWPPNLCFRSLLLGQNVLSICFGYFSLSSKWSLWKTNIQKKQNKMEKDQPITFIQTSHPAIIKSVIHEVLQSPEKYSSWDRQEPRIRHTSPKAFYCICLLFTQWGKLAVISQHVNESPFSPLATTALLIITAKQDAGFKHHKEAFICGSIWKPMNKSAKFVKVKDFSPCFVYPLLGSPGWVSFLKPSLTKCHFFTKTQCTLLYMVGLV